jgi:hypothetical protein
VFTAPLPTKRHRIVLRVCFYGNVFSESLPNNRYTRHNTFLSGFPRNESRMYLNRVILKATVLDFWPFHWRLNLINPRKCSWCVCHCIVLRRMSVWFFLISQLIEESNIIRINCIAKNHGPNCPQRTIAHQTTKLRSCDDTPWGGWGFHVLQYLLFCMFTLPRLVRINHKFWDKKFKKIESTHNIEFFLRSSEAESYTWLQFCNITLATA